MEDDEARRDTPIEMLRHDVMRRLDQLESQIANAAAVAAAAQTQVFAHVAVCDERQRQIERRTEERRRWEEDRAGEWRSFMAESRGDREKIRTEVASNAQTIRVEIREAAIRVLWWVVGLNLAGLVGMIAYWLKSFGPHVP